jgi:hypothetical protein
MEIIDALRQEEAKLQSQLTAIQGAIEALNGHKSGNGNSLGAVGGRPRRALSAVARARISKASKARWAKFRSEKGKVKGGAVEKRMRS